MEILLIEPYYTGSHQAWVDGYARHSHHVVRTLTLPGRFWKWRMHGGAVTLARCFREGDYHPDLILATDMLDLSTFLALTRDLTHDVPVALYFHENQLTYPPRHGERRDLHYGFINYASALLADAVFFNSRYHLEAFYDELPRLLKHFPDYNELDTVAWLRARSEVLPLGLDLKRHDRYRPPHPVSDVPAIVWNHRWEYDKNPREFFKAVYALVGMGLQFNLILMGESFRIKPEEFLEARERLADRIVQFGYVEDFSAYSSLLWRGDVCVSTALHEFFGTATAEAITCGCYPVLPRRLGYPDLVPQRLQAKCLYDDFDGLLARLQAFLTGARPPSEDYQALRTHISRFDWTEMAPLYDRRLAEVAAS
jgi:glycosyltransferase involved in cell wall biosynthesis